MPEPAVVTINGVEIFASGIHNGDNYSEQDLDGMISAAGQVGFTAPLKLGHMSDGDTAALLKAEGMPAFGYIKNLRRVGAKLLADFVNVPRRLASLIKNGAYKRVSAEIYWNYKNNQGSWPRVLKAVALLGGEIPAVTSLKEIEALYARTDTAGQDYKTYWGEVLPITGAMVVDAAAPSEPPVNAIAEPPVRFKEKGAVGYRLATEEDEPDCCGTCQFYTGGVEERQTGICSLVGGAIAADALCDLYEPTEAYDFDTEYAAEARIFVGQEVDGSKFYVVDRANDNTILAEHETFEAAEAAVAAFAKDPGFEAKHPRGPKGTPQGGKWADKPGGDAAGAGKKTGTDRQLRAKLRELGWHAGQAGSEYFHPDYDHTVHVSKDGTYQFEHRWTGGAQPAEEHSGAGVEQLVEHLDSLSKKRGYVPKDARKHADEDGAAAYAKDPEFERKHPRGGKGTPGGGQFAPKAGGAGPEKPGFTPAERGIAAGKAEARGKKTLINVLADVLDSYDIASRTELAKAGSLRAAVDIVLKADTGVSEPDLLDVIVDHANTDKDAIVSLKSTLLDVIDEQDAASRAAIERAKTLKNVIHAVGEADTGLDPDDMFDAVIEAIDNVAKKHAADPDFEQKHKRAPKGSPTGGQFAPKGGMQAVSSDSAVAMSLIEHVKKAVGTPPKGFGGFGLATQTGPGEKPEVILLYDVPRQVRHPDEYGGEDTWRKEITEWNEFDGRVFDVLKKLEKDFPTHEFSIAAGISGPGVKVWKKAPDSLIGGGFGTSYTAGLEDATDDSSKLTAEELSDAEPELVIVEQHDHTIVKRGTKWCVTSKDGSKTLGCHDTEAEAKAQLAAVEASKAAAHSIDPALVLHDVVVELGMHRIERVSSADWRLARTDGTVVETYVTERDAMVALAAAEPEALAVRTGYASAPVAKTYTVDVRSDPEHGGEALSPPVLDNGAASASAVAFVAERADTMTPEEIKKLQDDLAAARVRIVQLEGELQKSNQKVEANARATEENTKMHGQIAELQAKVQEMETRDLDREDKIILDKFVAAGKLLPAERQYQEHLLVISRDKVDLFTEGGVRKERPMRVAVIEALEKRPTVMQFGEVVRADGGDDGLGNPDPAVELSNRIAKHREQNSAATYEQAYKAVLGANPKLKQRYAERSLQ